MFTPPTLFALRPSADRGSMAGTMRWGAVIALWVLGLSSCKSRNADPPDPPVTLPRLPDDASGVFEKMHAAACGGDVAAFFSHVAESKVLDNLAAKVDGGPSVRATVNLDSWRKDIKEKAMGGEICRWSFDKDAWEKSENLLRIEARSRKGKRRFLLFGSDGGQLKLTDYDVENPIATVDLAIEIRPFLKDYKDNELRGDAQYKGKRVLLVGKAGEVKRVESGAIYLIVNNGTEIELPEGQCFFGDADTAGLASITRGQLVAVTGVVTGLTVNVLLKDCALASTVALEDCYKLKEAGVASQCVVKWMKSDHVALFLATDPPAGLTPVKMDDFVSRMTGFVTFNEDDASQARVLALATSRVGTVSKTYVGSPTARVVVELPLERRTGYRHHAARRTGGSSRLAIVSRFWMAESRRRSNVFLRALR